MVLLGMIRQSNKGYTKSADLGEIRETERTTSDVIRGRLYVFADAPAVAGITRAEGKREGRS